MSNEYQGGYTRRQELTCTEAQIATYADIVLHENEKIYVRMNSGVIRMKLGDGVTNLRDLPYTKVFDGDLATVEAWLAEHKTQVEGKFDKANVAQGLGDSEEKVLSQKAATEAVEGLNDKVSVEINVTNDLVYASGQYTSIDNVLYDEPTLKYTIVSTDRLYDTITITYARVANNIAIWLKKDGKIVSTINRVEESYFEKIDVKGIDEVWFSANANHNPTVKLYGLNFYTKQETKDYCKNFLTESNITDVPVLNPNFTDDKVGYIHKSGTIEADGDCRYSDRIPVKGGEKIRITRALMNANSCLAIYATFRTIFYQLATPSTDATFEIVLPNDAQSIRYSVLSGSAKTSKVSYVSDYKHFREDFIPSLYRNGLGSRNDYPIITFIDDDGYSAYLTKVKPHLDAYGYKGTLAVIKQEVGIGGALTLEQLQTLANEQYDIVSHSASHSETIFSPSQNDAVTDEQIYNDLVESRNWLDANGFNSECIVFPFGHYGTKTKRFVMQAIKAGFQFGCDANTARSNNDIVINTFWLDRLFVIKDENGNIERYKNAIDGCIANNGWLILSTHAAFNDEMGTAEEAGAYFRSIVDYIHEKGVAVKTFKEASEIKKNVCSIGYLHDKSNKLYIGRDGKIYN